MYGMVNQAVRELIIANFGEDTWATIHTQAEAPETFLNFEQYDDGVTYRLVAAASDALELPAETVLKTFGHFWVTDVATKSYADLMQRSGTTFLDFLKGLDHMHSLIQVSFPDYTPPSFRVKALSDDRLQLDYYSHREGLLPFVVGLLEGLAAHFETSFTCEHVPDESHPMPCKRLILNLQSPDSAALE